MLKEKDMIGILTKKLYEIIDLNYLYTLGPN
jgi:hypothetical protein